jgi:cytidylate kinase
VYYVYYLCFKHNRFVSERDRHSNSESIHMIAEEEFELYDLVLNTDSISIVISVI